MEMSPKLFASYALVRNTSGEVLCAKDSSGNLVLLGGAALDGENALQTVTRTLKAQIGVDVGDSQASVVFAKIVDGHKIIPVYECTVTVNVLPDGLSWQSETSLCVGNEFHASMFETLAKRKQAAA